MHLLHNIEYIWPGKTQEIHKTAMHSGADGRDYLETVNIRHDLDFVLPGHEFDMDQSQSALLSGDR